MQFVLTVLAALVAVSTVAAPVYGDEEQIQLKDCPTEVNPSGSDRITCGYMDVPLDWDEPETHDPVKLGFVKIPAKDTAVSTIV
jgi:hypothetical protein